MEASSDDVLFSINDLTLSNDTKTARGDGTGVRVAFRKPDCETGERKRTSYRKVLIDATQKYKQASTDAKQGGVVRDFVADLSREIQPGDIWWLLPTQTAAFINNRDVLLTDPAYDTKANDVAIASVSLVLKKKHRKRWDRALAWRHLTQGRHFPPAIRRASLDP